jgi:transposase-like protein
MQRGRSMAGKVAVMGLLDRHGKDGVSQVRMTVLKGRKSGTLQGEVRKHVEVGSNVYTDAFYSYRGLQGDFQHGFVDHAEAYVDGQIHTNSCENFWSLLKRGLKGTYVSVEPFHLFRYLDEQAFRFNNRVMNDAERFALALKGVLNKRLTYTALTGSELPQTC